MRASEAGPALLAPPSSAADPESRVSYDSVREEWGQVTNRELIAGVVFICQSLWRIGRICDHKIAIDLEVCSSVIANAIVYTAGERSTIVIDSQLLPHPHEATV